MKDIKKFYDPANYKPGKNSVPVYYKGVQYLSKAQCMALEGISKKELEEYLQELREAARQEDEDYLPF